jgi:hypothetical protein
MLVPHETLDKEFLSLADAEGLADIEHLNKVLDRAVNLKNFLKGKERIPKVAEFVAKHYTRERGAARLQGLPRRRGPRGLRPIQARAGPVPSHPSTAKWCTPATTTTAPC